VTNPIGLLRDGIQAGDWKKVCEGFTALTGETLPPPSQRAWWEGKVREAVANLSSLLTPGVAPPTKSPAPAPEPVKPSKKSPLKKVSPRVEVEVAPEPVPEPPRAQTLEEKFAVKHGKQAGSGTKGEACRLVPHEKPPPAPVLDLSDVAPNEIEESRALSLKKRPEPRRPPSTLVGVKCFKCEKKFEVPRTLAPRKLERDDDSSSYQCEKCLRKEL
jgi:hypothetical protein